MQSVMKFNNKHELHDIDAKLVLILFSCRDVIIL